MIEACVYDAAGVERHDANSAAALRRLRAAPGTTWVRATDASPAELDRVTTAFDVHPLVVEDVRGDARPKTEEFLDYSFVLVKDAELRRGDQSFDEEIATATVGVVLGDDWVLTLSTAPVPAVESVWAALERGDERLLTRGPDFTAYRVIDAVVDEYFDILDRIETGIEAVEEAVLVSTAIETLERINATRRDLLAFRKVAWPMREAVNALARGDPDQVAQPNEKFFRDVADHLVQVVDLIETYRDLTGGARDIYLNTLSQSTNEVMKRLTVVAVIFLPLTFIAGVYGMNFDTSAAYNMPELAWPYAYPAVLLGMALIAVVMLGYFRQKEYL